MEGGKERRSEARLHRGRDHSKTAGSCHERGAMRVCDVATVKPGALTNFCSFHLKVFCFVFLFLTEMSHSSVAKLLGR